MSAIVRALSLCELEDAAMDGLEGPGAPRPGTPSVPAPSTRALQLAGHTLAAESLRAVAEAVEPHVTPHVGELVAIHQGTVDAGMHRFKSMGSLTRKIIDDALILNVTPPVAANRINDTLRYTVVFNPDDFSTGVTSVLRGLEGRGFAVDPSRIWNFFIEGNRYKGLHAIVQTPAFGDQAAFRFEIQFHTPESFEIKQATDHLYGIFRDQSRPLKVRRSAYDSLVSASAIIEHPRGIDDVGKLKPSSPPAA